MDLERKKVLFVIDTLQIGGAEQSLLENTIRFKKITPVICHLYSGDALKSRFTEKNIRVHSAGIMKKYGFREAYARLDAIVSQERPDAIVAYLTRSEIVSRLVGRKHKIPVIGSFVSNLYSREYNRTLSFTAKRAVSFFKWINRITARLCAGFIANSEAVKQANAFHLHVPLSKIKVISRGRDSKIFPFQPPVLTEGSPVRFLNIGRLVPVKAQHQLIRAFRLFLDTYSGSTLTIIGEGPSRKMLEALVDELHLHNHVFLPGARHDVPQLIHQYDCFVFPSLSEGFSGSVVEAMFAGQPVLASDISPNLEAISHLETGYIFEKDSVPAITEALDWFMANRDKAVAFAGKANVHARQYYELDHIAAELEGYLSKIID